MVGRTCLASGRVTFWFIAGVLCVGCGLGPSATYDGSADVGTSYQDVSTLRDGAVVMDDGEADTRPIPRQITPLNLCGADEADGGLPPPESRRAALPNGTGGVTCVMFGVDPTMAAASEFADTAGLPAPIVYVRAGATGSGASPADPIGSLDAAIRVSPPAATLAIARGPLDVPVTLTLTRNLTIVGTGTSETGGTVLRGAAGTGTLFAVSSSSGSLSLRRVRVSLASAADARGIDVQADARADLADVHVTGGATGIAVQLAGSLQTDRVNVVLTTDDAIVVHGQATLRSTTVREGRGHGVMVRGRLVANELLVSDQERGGIRLEGRSTLGPDQLERVACVANAGYGIRIGGAGRETNVRMSSIVATAAVAISNAAYGIYLTDGATATLDADRVAPGNRGHGTLVAANRYAGVVATGTAGALNANALRIVRNEGPGMVVEGGIGSLIVNETYFGFNVAVGLALWGSFARASTVEIRCDMFEGTVSGAALFGPAMVEAGDGMFAMSATDMPWMSSHPISGSLFVANDRFGVCLWNAGMTIMGGSFDRNRFHIGRYGAATRLAPATDQTMFLDRNTASPAEADLRGPSGTERMADPGF